MRIASRTDYALRAALELAAASGAALTTEELARLQGIPARYLGNILAEMRRADVVSARRGPEGGWTLGRPANAISLGQVIRAVGGALAQVGGSRPENLEYAGPAQHLQEVWVAVRGKFVSVWTARPLRRDAKQALDEWSMDPSGYTIRRATLTLDPVPTRRPK